MAELKENIAIVTIANASMVLVKRVTKEAVDINKLHTS